MGRSLRQSSAWQLLQTVFGTGSELAIVLAVAATRTPAEFGQFVLALSAAKLIFLLFEPRVHEFLTPKLARYLGRSCRGVWMWTLWSLRLEISLNSLALLVCGTASILLPAMGMPIGTAIILASGAYTFGNTLLKFSGLAILRTLGEIKKAAAFSIVGGICKMTVVYLLLVTNRNLPSMLWALTFIACATSIAQAVTAYHQLASRVRPRKYPSVGALRAANWKNQRSLLVSNYATGLVEIMHREVDVQIAALLAGPLEAGRYRLAKMLAMTMMELLNPIVLMLLPDLARRLTFEGLVQTKRFLRKMTRSLGLIGIASALLVSSASAIYLTWFAPQQAQAWLPTAILILVFTTIAPWIWCQALLVAAGRPGAYLRGSALGAIIGMGLALTLVTRFGAIGSACAFGVGLIITTAFAAKSAGQALHSNSSPHPPSVIF